MFSGTTCLSFLHILVMCLFEINQSYSEYVLYITVFLLTQIWQISKIHLCYYMSESRHVLVCFVQPNNLTLMISGHFWKAQMLLSLLDTFSKLMFCYPPCPRRMRSVSFLWYAVGHDLHIIHTLLLTQILKNTHSYQPLLNICSVLWLIWLCWCFEQFLLL